MRKLLRRKARANMEKMGMTSINKQYPVYGEGGRIVRTESKFQKFWRQYC